MSLDFDLNPLGKIVQSFRRFKSFLRACPDFHRDLSPKPQILFPGG